MEYMRFKHGLIEFKIKTGVLLREFSPDVRSFLKTKVGIEIISVEGDMVYTAKHCYRYEYSDEHGPHLVLIR